MRTSDSTLINLEKKFWQSMVDEDTDTALEMLNEPALMVTSQGALQFNHREYREMAEKGQMVIKSFELSDVNVMFPNEDTAVLTYKVRQSMGERGEDESEAVEQLMADSSVWMRKDGEWRCFMHTETEIEDEDDEDAD